MVSLTANPKGHIVNHESYIGMDVLTCDGEVVGRVKEPRQRDAARGVTEYLVIDRPMARDIVVPASVPSVSGDHLVLPFGMSVVEGAPNVNLGRQTMTVEEKWILDSFYSLWTGAPVARLEIAKGQRVAPPAVDGE
jgi:PRC-barrel domain